MKNSNYLLLATLVSTFLANIAKSQTWAGTTSTDWNTSTNWNPVGVPTSASNVTIPGSVASSNWPVFASNVTINSINMLSGSQLNVNGNSLTLVGNNAYIAFAGATINNSNGATDIVINVNTGINGYNTYLKSNAFNDHTIFNITGSNTFYEGDAALPDQFNGNVTYNINSGLTVFICYALASQYNGNLTITRTVAGTTSMFPTGATITGNFSYTNNFGGPTGLGTASTKTNISGTLNIACNYPSPSTFGMVNLTNQTTGGNVNVQNSTGMYLQKDTLKLSSLSITGYKSGASAEVYNNSIIGNVTFADDASYAGGWGTYIRNNHFTGTTNISNNGTNSLFDADGGGQSNHYIGNTTFNANGSATLYISHGSKSQFDGNLNINRTVAGTTYVFTSGGDITGNFTYTNNTAGNTWIGNPAAKTSIGGTVNIMANFSTPNPFEIHRMINQTSGGVISVQNSAGFYLQKDTLKVASLNITGYKNGAIGEFVNNSIIGNLTIADDATRSSGWHTFLRNNEITGITSLSNNGNTALVDANGAGEGNHYIGNTTFTSSGPGPLYISHGDTSIFDGNLIINRTGTGFTQAFNSGGIINGNFSCTNNFAGDIIFGNIASKTNITGTINISVNDTTPSVFQMHRIINQTTGGNISLQNTVGFYLLRDTLNVSTLSISNYRTGAHAYFLNNAVTGNVTTADHASYSGGYATFFQNNILTGSTVITNNGINALYDANDGGTGNHYIGNTTFSATGPGALLISHGDTSQFDGNLTIIRTGTGYAQAFNSGGIVNGNFAFTNNVAGNTYLGTVGSKTNIAGTINISVNDTTPGIFQMLRLVNQTAGGSIIVQNTAGFNLQKDTLTVTTLSLTGYRGGISTYFLNNSITGNVTTADHSSYGGGYATYFENNVITGTTSITNNGSNALFDSDNANQDNYYFGNTTFTAAGTGSLFVSHGDTSRFNGNLTINRTAAGHTQVFNSGGIITGNFSYTNNTAGNTYFGNPGIRTSIAGMVNITANYTVRNLFEMFRIVNQTGGGSINVQNTYGYNVRNDTLIVNSLSLTGYGGTNYAYFLNNAITGNVISADDVSYVGGFASYFRNNIITGNTSIANNGSNVLYDADGAGFGNKYIGNITYTRAGGGISVAAGDSNEISQNLTLNSAAGITLGKIIFNGSSDGIINQLGTQPVNVSEFIMQKTGSGKITLADSVTIGTNLAFISGNIYSSAGNNLIFPDNIGYTGLSAASHVVGPVSKIGDDAFTFPVGSPITLNDIRITAPVGVTSKFSAQYKNQNPNIDGYNTALKAGSFGAANISTAGYWDVLRLSGGSTVTLTLGFNTNPYESYPVLSNLKVAHWNGSQWDDHGNGGTTGTSASGTVVNSVPVTSYSPFALASVINTYFLSSGQPGPGPDGTPIKIKSAGGLPGDSVKILPGGTYISDSIFLVGNGSTTTFRLKDASGYEKDTTITTLSAPFNYASASGSGTVNFTGWRNFVWMTDAGNNIMGAIRDNGLTLGITTMNTYFSAANVATSPNGNVYLKRSFRIQSQFAPVGTKRVIFYVGKTEFNNLVAADPASFPNGINSLTITKYTGPQEDSLFNPMPGGNSIIIPNSSITIVDLGSMYLLRFDVTGFSGFYIGGNNSNLNICVGSTISLPSDISGSTYQWQVDNGSGFVNIGDGGSYSGTNTSALNIINAPSGFYGYKFRCVVNGVSFSQVYTIKYQASWEGSVSDVWENPANWNCGVLPDGNTDVVVNPGKLNYPKLGVNATIRTIKLNPGVSVTVKTGTNLTILK